MPSIATPIAPPAGEAPPSHYTQQSAAAVLGISDFQVRLLILGRSIGLTGRRPRCLDGADVRRLAARYESNPDERPGRRRRAQ